MALGKPGPKALALLVALAFALSVTERAGLHACPTHDAIAQPATHSAGAHHHGPAPKHASHSCTCLGTCCASTVIVPLGQAALVPFGSSPVHAHISVAADIVRPVSPAHLQPFAIGPPLRHTA